jgi:hypothetical protein
MTTATKLDLGKLHKAEYATPRKPVLLVCQPAVYLAIDGTGAPGSDAFAARIGALYGIAFTVKMTRKFAGLQDYTVSKLEARYFFEAGHCIQETQKEEWRWQLLIRTPDFVQKSDLAAAVTALNQRGKGAHADEVRLEQLDEGQCVQMLHVGPYEQEGESAAQMLAFAESKGLRYVGPHHEIYISDPRRVEPAKLKTILRLPVRPAS